MMGMNLGMAMEQGLKISGGATDSIFPAVENLLNGSTEMWKSLEYVAARKNMGRYQSVMDFIFCEIWTGYRRACMKYYDDLGDELRLKHQITVKQRGQFELIMLQALQVAHEAMCEKRRLSWEKFRTEVLHLAA
jgi:hypothetical protein